MLSHRQNCILADSNGAPAWGAGYTVTAYPTGARVVSVSTVTITVDAGHSFAAGDKFLASPGSSNTYSGTDEVQSVTATTIVMGEDWSSLSTGDLLVNLGADGGTTTPNYNASGKTIYAESDGGGTVSESRVTCDAYGNYDYYYLAGGAIWELIRDSSGAVVSVIDGYAGGVPFYSQDAEPTAPASFAIWYDTGDGSINFCLYDGATWEWNEIAVPT